MSAASPWNGRFRWTWILIASTSPHRLSVVGVLNLMTAAVATGMSMCMRKGKGMGMELEMELGMELWMLPRVPWSDGPIPLTSLTIGLTIGLMYMSLLDGAPSDIGAPSER